MPVQRPSPIARRFFNKFYRWTLLTSPAPARHTCGNVQHRTLSISTHLRQDGVAQEISVQDSDTADQSVNILKYVATDFNRSAGAQARYSHGHGRLRSRQDDRQWQESHFHRAIENSADNNNTTSKPNAQRFLRNIRVQSPAERPFALLDAFEAAVRYRSNVEITYEFALPEDCAQVLFERYGSDLKGMNEKYGAQVEVGSVYAKEGTSQALRSIIVSGTFSEASRAWGLFMSLKKDDISRKFKAKNTVQRHPYESSDANTHPNRSSPMPEQGHLQALERESSLPGDTRHFQVRCSSALRRHIIGTRGSTIDRIKRQSGVTKLELRTNPRKTDILFVELYGESSAILTARTLVEEAIEFGKEAIARESTLRAGELPPPEYFSRIKIMNPVGSHDVTRYLIGKQGDTRRRLQMQAHCRIVSRDLEDIFVLHGSQTGIENAKQLIHGMVDGWYQQNWHHDTPSKNVVDLESGVWNPATSRVHKSGMIVKVEQEETTANDLTRTTRLADDLRAVLRPLTQPVVVITTRDKIAKSVDLGLERARGVTVSSFSTVALYPKPMISFNLRLPSRTWDALRSSKRLCVHILSATPEGAAISHAFSQPHEKPWHPFTRVRALSYAHTSLWAKGRSPPKIHAEGAVLARILADMVEKKCVHVGDHMIVVAEVTDLEISGWNEETKSYLPLQERMERLEMAEGLGYGKRGYRSMGEAIDAAELPTLEEAIESQVLQRAEVASEHETDLAEILPSEEMGLQTAGAREATVQRDGEDVDPAHSRANPEGGQAESMKRQDDNVSKNDDANKQALGTRRAAMEEEEEYDLGFPHKGESHRTVGQQGAFSQPTPEMDSELSREVGRLLNFASQQPRPAKGSISRRGYCTLATWSCEQRRSYSGSMRFVAQDEDATNQSSEHDDPSNQVTDPALLNQTIDDFLGQPPENAHQIPRFRALLRAKEVADRASRELEAALADGSLTPERSLQLEHIITINERHVAKKLAFRAVEELQRMLDKGKLDVRRTQWLEQTVEKGMVVVIEQAKIARGMYDKGELDEDKWNVVKERLEKEHAVLNQEARRLRVMMEDEDE